MAIPEASILIELEQFRAFVLDRLNRTNNSATIDDLYDQWRFQNPVPSERDADLKAIGASLRDFKNGERGRPLKAFLNEFRQGIT